jgi:putative transposase
MVRTFVFKLKPTAAQGAALERYLRTTRDVYNAALEQRIAAWHGGEHRSWIDQSREIKDLREAGLLDGCHVHTVQHALRRLDLAYAAFFSRCKQGVTRKGFPRFKGARYWRSIHFKEYGRGGCELRDGLLRVSKVGAIRVRQHRQLEGTPKTCAIIHKPDGWFAHIVCDLGDSPELRGGDRVTGIDLGLESFATLADGEQIANPRHLRHAEKKLKAEGRALSRKRRGSRRRSKQRERLALAHLKLARIRRDFHHNLALNLVQRFDRIAVEDLAVAAMRSAGGAYKRGLNRSMADASWGQFLAILAEKCEANGVELVSVDPKYTSQTCSACGLVRKKALSERRHECPCGASLHRDHNAAINIQHRAWAVPVAEAA